MATGRLTWQNVAAPDFSGAAQTQSIAAEAMDRALGRVSGAITAFDNNRKDMADAAVLRNAMQYQNADQLQAAIASGALMNGVNPDHVRVDALLKAQQQAGQLMALDKDRQAIEQNKVMNPLRVRELELKNDGTSESNNFTQYTHSQTKLKDSREEANYQGAQEGASIWNQWVMSGQLDTPEGRMAVREQLTTSPRDQFLANQLKAYSPELFTPLNLGSAARTSLGAIGGAPSPAGTPAALSGGFTDLPQQDASSYNTVVGGKEMPLGTMTLGAWNDVVAPQLIEQTRGTSIMEPHVRDKGSSASGRYQLTATTVNDIAPKVFGENWRSVPMDAHAQEAMGKYLYDRRIGSKSAMTDEWRGLAKIKGADAAGAWDGIPWDAASAVIAQFESNGTRVLGSNPTMDDVRKFAQEYQQRRAQTNSDVAEVNAATSGAVDALGTAAAGGPMAARIAEAAKDGSSLQAVAKRVGDIVGIDQQRMSQYISEVATQIKQSPAVAGALLENAATAKTWFGWGSDNKISDDTLKGIVKDFNTNYAEKLRTGILTQELYKQRSEKSTETQAAVDKQRAAVKQLEETVKRFPPTSQRGVGAQRELEAQRALLEQMIQSQNVQSDGTHSAGMSALQVGKPAPKPSSTPGSSSASASTTGTSSNFYGSEAIAAREAARKLRDDAEVASAKQNANTPRQGLADTSRITQMRDEIKKLTPERVRSLTKDEALDLIARGLFPLLSEADKRIVQSKARQ